MNTEQSEALQNEVNKYRDNYILTLPTKQQEEFKIVEQACRLLEENKIPFYLFTYQPHNESKVNVMWQWNNLLSLIHEESAELRNKSFQLIGRICSLVNKTFLKKEIISFQNAGDIKDFIGLFNYATSLHHDRIFNGETESNQPK